MPTATRLNSKDLLLLILYAPESKDGPPNTGVKGRTRLVKLVFLFEEEFYSRFKFNKRISERDLPTFRAWDFGPFSSQVYGDLEFLARLEYILEAEDPEGRVMQEETAEADEWLDDITLEPGDDLACVRPLIPTAISLTECALRYVEQHGLYSSLSVSQQESLLLLKQRYNRIPLVALLRYVYKTYPDMAKKSKQRLEVF